MKKYRSSPDHLTFAYVLVSVPGAED